MAEIVIVGGGPVGVVAGILLTELGAAVRVLERRAEPTQHSRAIGIHPPALRLLDRIDADLGERMRAAGVLIREGVVRSRGTTLARLALGGGEHPPVLALPQHETERMLRAELERRAPGALVTGCTVSGVTVSADGAAVHTDAGEIDASVVIGADGPRSVVREAIGITPRRRDYPDRYLMGDFADETGDGAAAVIHLEPAGVVESFPLPGGHRRWVAHTGHHLARPDARTLARLVAERTGVALDPATTTMISAFAVRRRIVEHPLHARVALIGDAAHEISPIGGQGMALGWLDAADITDVLATRTRDDAPFTPHDIARVNRMLHHRAVAAARRAEFDMAMGRPRRRLASAGRDLAVRLAVSPPLRARTAASMTMGGLG